MNILALETASVACSVVLLQASKTYTRYDETPRAHSRLILPMVDEILSEANLTMTDVDCIAFSQGPGAFTGVRVAVGVAQGLAYGADIPVVGVSTLQAIAQRAYRERGVTRAKVIVDARIQEVYLGDYVLDESTLMHPLHEDLLCSPEEVFVSDMDNQTTEPHQNLLKKIALIGSGLTEYSSKFNFDINRYPVFPNIEPHAQDIAMLAAPLFKDGKAKSASEALPIYLRDKVTG